MTIIQEGYPKVTKNADGTYTIHCMFMSVSLHTKEDVDHYLFSHEQYALDFLKTLQPVVPQPFWCRHGFHKMKTHSVKDGGGIVTYWGYCTRCNRWKYASDTSLRFDHNSLR